MKISALLREAPGTPALSLDQDLMQRAKLKFPGYDSQQALSLYMADKLQQQQKIDASQNNLINSQRNAIQTLQGELDANDDEIERIKQLTAKVTAGGADTRARAKVSGDELEKLQKQLEELKSKPGMDSGKYKEIEQQIASLANSKGTDDNDVKKLQSLVDKIQNSKKFNFDEVLKDLEKTRAELNKKDQEVTNKQHGLDDLRNTFDNSKERVDIYKKDIQKQLNNAVNAAKKQVKQEVQQEVETENNAIKAIKTQSQQDAIDINDMKNDMRQSFKFINQYIAKLSNPQTIKTTKKIPDVSWVPDQDKNPKTNTGSGYVQESITEDGRIVPVNQYKNKYYNQWIIKHLPGLFALFKRRYGKELTDKGYSDKQIAHILEEYIPVLYDSGDEKTPLTPEQVQSWMHNVVVQLYDNIPDSPAKINQLELFSESLDRILQLASIKKG
jgi:hypothetical protein